MSILPPNSQVPVVDARGVMMPAWYKFFRDFFAAAGSGSINDPEFEGYVSLSRPSPAIAPVLDPMAFMGRSSLPDPRLDALYGMQCAVDRSDIDALRRRVEMLEAALLAGRAT